MPPLPVSEEVLRRCCRTAARLGLAGHLTDPRTGEQVPAPAVVEGLIETVRPTLSEWGDEAVVLPTLTRLIDVGGGAALHRRMLRAVDTPAAYVRALSELTCLQMSS